MRSPSLVGRREIAFVDLVAMLTSTEGSVRSTGDGGFRIEINTNAEREIFIDVIALITRKFAMNRAEMALASLPKSSVGIDWPAALKMIILTTGHGAIDARIEHSGRACRCHWSVTISYRSLILA